MTLLSNSMAGSRCSLDTPAYSLFSRVELMIASNTITVAHAEALLKATPPEQRTNVKPAEREKKTAAIEQIQKLEQEMNQLQEKYQEA